MDKVIFRIGSIEIKWYAFLILIGAFLAIIMVIKEGKRFNIPGDFLFNLAFWVIIFGIIGARIYYVLFNLEYYSNWVDIFKIWEGGLAIHGGLIAGLITAIIYCKKYKVRTIRIIDLAAPGVLLAQAIGRWGNFFNQEAYGIATSLEKLQAFKIPNFIIEGMKIEGAYHHPTFLYESLWCLLGVIIILIVRRISYIKIGQPTALYLIWYSVGRFFIEMLRVDSLRLGGFRVAQIVSIVMFLVGWGIIMITSRKGHYEDLYNSNEENINF